MLLSDYQISKFIDIRPGIRPVDVDLSELEPLVKIDSIAEEPLLQDLVGGLTELLGPVCLEQLGVFLTVLVVFMLPQPVVLFPSVAGLGISRPVVVHIVEEGLILDVIDIEILEIFSSLGVWPKSVNGE